MAIPVTDNLDGTLTIRPDPEDYQRIQRALKDHAATILQQVLEGWARGEYEMQARMDAAALLKARDALTVTERVTVPDAIRTKLGI